MKAQDGFTLIELLIVMAVIAILATVVSGGLLRARVAANEASAIAAVRAIVSGETTYAASCGGGGYAQTLADLGLTPPGTPPFISPDLVGGDKSGYALVVSALTGSSIATAAAATCNGAASDAMDGYHVSAAPDRVGITGQRSFASESNGTMYQDLSGAAIANPIPAGLDPVQ